MTRRALLRRTTHPVERWCHALGSTVPVLVSWLDKLRAVGHRCQPSSTHVRAWVMPPIRQEATPTQGLLRPHESVASWPHALRVTHEKAPRPHRPAPASGDARQNPSRGPTARRRPTRTFRTNRSTGPEYVARNWPEGTSARSKRAPSPPRLGSASAKARRCRDRSDCRKAERHSI